LIKETSKAEKRLMGIRLRHVTTPTNNKSCKSAFLNDVLHIEDQKNDISENTTLLPFSFYG